MTCKSTLYHQIKNKPLKNRIKSFCGVPAIASSVCLCKCVCVFGGGGGGCILSHRQTHTAASDSMVKLILLLCLEMCLLSCAVTLISLRQSRPGYKISVFVAFSLFSLFLCPFILSTSGMRFPSLDILINGRPEPHPTNHPWLQGESALDDCTPTFIYVV